LEGKAIAPECERGVFWDPNGSFSMSAWMPGSRFEALMEKLAIPDSKKHPAHIPP
jgi:hypothetical protein